MLRTVHFHGALRRKFKLAKVELDADSVGEAMRGLSLMLPGFTQYVRDRQYLVTAANDVDDLVIDKDALLLNLGQRRHIHLTPSAQAAGLETILIVGFALTAAVSLAATFLLKPKAPDANARERKDQSYIFGGGVNSAEQGHPVALIYGERVRVGSIVVSGGISTTDISASALEAGSGGNYIGSSPGVLGGEGGEGGRSWEVPREIQAFKGGKSGGGSGRVAEESPNTLRSQATVKIVDLVGEGEIGGLVDGLKSVYLDGTPVQNADGSFNFSGYSLQERVGLPDQDPMPGHTQQETGDDVGVDVTARAPVVRRFADPVVDVIRVTVGVNSLYEQDTSNGDLKPTSVQIAIDHQSNGGGFTQVVLDTIQGKTNSPYQRSYDIRLVGEGPHDIRLRRLTPDSELASLKNETRWESVFEITEAKLMYPDSALYGITVDAKQFGSNIPVRTYEVRGLVIDVPSNYDVATRQYTGIWDGTFKRAVCGNPAWVLYDIIKHNRYGLGKRIPLSSIDKYGLYAVAQYCDGLLSDGMGGLQPRYTINTCITSQESAYNLLASIASAFRGFVHWGSGSVMVTQDRPEDPSMLVTPANVVDGKLSYKTVVDKQKLRSVAIVYWNDPNDEYRLVPEIVEDKELLTRIGWEPGEPVVRFGCTNRAEAHYAGLWMLDDQRYANKALQYEAADDHNFVGPSAVISVADPKYTVGRRGGRIASATADSVTLDSPVELAAGAIYKLRVTLPNGTVNQRRVASPAGTTATLDLLGAAWDNPPMAGAVWALESDTVANRQFRVRSATADEPPYSIEAVVYDPNSHARVEQGINLPPADFIDLPTGPLSTPDKLRAVEFLLAEGTSSIPAVQFSWVIEPDPRVLFFQGQFQRPGGNWEPLEDSSAMSRVIRNAEPGEWGFMVRSVDGLGRKTGWAIGRIELTGQVDSLPNVQGLTIAVNNEAFQASLVWVMPEDTRPLRAEVMYSADANYANAVPMGVVNAQEYSIAQPGYYWVRTRFLNSVSANPPGVHATANDLPVVEWDAVTGRPGNLAELDPAAQQTIEDLLNGAGGDGGAAESAAAAEAAKQAAEQARNQAQAATAAAEMAEEAAGNYAAQADTSKQLSEAAKQLAATAAGEAGAARDAANSASSQAYSNAQAAAQYVTDASGYAATANGQATVATQSANDAGQSASNASASASTAATKAGEAGVFRDQAATSASNANGSAVAAAASSTLSASTYSKILERDGNEYFDNGTDGWTGTAGMVVVPNGPHNRTNVIRTPVGESRTIEGRKQAVTSDDQRFELRASWLAGDAPNDVQFYVGFISYDANGNLVDATDGTGNYPLCPGTRFNSAYHGWVDRQVVIGRGVTQPSPYGGTRAIPAGAAYIRPVAYLNYTNTGGSTGWIDYFVLEDVTQREKASGFAAASSSSAASAAASESAAGQRASAAETSRQAAETAKGQAESARTSAAQSESNAAGSASSAAQSATVSAGSADQAVYQAAKGITANWTDLRNFTYPNESNLFASTRPQRGTTSPVMSFPDVAGEGRVVQEENGNSSVWVTNGYLKLETGNTYAVEGRWRMVRLATNSSWKPHCYFGWAVYNGAGDYLGNYYAYADYTDTLDTWINVFRERTAEDIRAAHPTAAYVSPLTILNHNDNQSGLNSAMQVSRLTTRNSTAEKLARDSATASSENASLASAKADAAGQSALASETSRQQAAGSAGEALAYRNTAADYASNAAGSASSASTSAGVAASAQAVSDKNAADLFPGFETKGKNWSWDTQTGAGGFWEQHEKGAGLAFAPGFGNYIYLAPVGTGGAGWIKTVAGKRYRAGVWVWQWSAPNGYGGNARVYWEGDRKDHDSPGDYLGSTADGPNATLAFYHPVPNGAWHYLESDLLIDASWVSDPKRYWVRPRINIDNAPSGAGYAISGWAFRDVTAEYAAGQAANAASGSAANASASATAAGQSATAADGYKNSAQTAAGQAEASRSSAATSASDAQGSANSAATNSTLSATAAKDAGGAANAPRNPGASLSNFVADQFSQMVTTTNLRTQGFTAPDGVLAVAGAGHFGPVAVSPVDRNKRYRFGATIRIRATTAGNQAELGHLCFVSWFAADGTFLGSPAVELDVSTMNAGQTRHLTRVFSAGDIPTNAAFYKVHVRTNNYCTTEIHSIYSEDVEASEAAKDSAAAANTSASTAAASATAAGQSASAANTSKLDAQTAAGNAASYRTEAATSASDALGYRNAAATSATLSAATGATRGLTPNGTFEKNAALWNVSAGAAWVENTGDARGVVRFPDGGTGSITSDPLINVDASGVVAYRVRARFASRGNNMRHYLGLQCFNSNGDYLGNVYIPGQSGESTPWAWNQKEGTFRGELSVGSTPAFVGGATAFIAGTRAVQPLFLANYPQDGGPFPGVVDLDYLYLEEYTGAVDAANSASAANTSAGQASTSATNASNSASAANQSKLDAQAAYSGAQGSASNAANSASAANTSAGQASASAGAAGSSASAANQSKLDAQAANSTAQSAASAAAGSAAQADASRSLAQTYATLSSSFSAAASNKNDKFANWTTATSLPDFYQPWASEGNWRFSRAGDGGAGSPYAVYTQNDAAGVNSGFHQGSIAMYPGYWVLEATVRVDANNIRGAGVWTDAGAGINFAVSADTAGVTDVGLEGRIRTFSRIFYMSSSITTNLYAMHGWTGFGEVHPRYMTWFSVRLRPATQAEINGNKALDNAATNAARIEQVNTTLAADIGSAASRVANVEARAGNLEARTGVSETAIADLVNNRSSARVELVAVTPGGRAQMTLRSSSNGGAGIDFVGDVQFMGTKNGYTFVMKPDAGQFIIYDPNGVDRVFIGVED